MIGCRPSSRDGTSGVYRPQKSYRPASRSTSACSQNHCSRSDGVVNASHTSCTGAPMGTSARNAMSHLLRRRNGVTGEGDAIGGAIAVGVARDEGLEHPFHVLEEGGPPRPVGQL